MKRIAILQMDKEVEHSVFSCITFRKVERTGHIIISVSLALDYSRVLNIITEGHNFSEMQKRKCKYRREST